MSGARRDWGRIGWAYVCLLVLGGLLGLVLWRMLAIVTGAALSPWPGNWPIRWAQPWAFSLALGAVAAWWLDVHRRRRRVPTLLYSRVADAARTRPGWGARLASLPAVLRALALVLLALALARPQAHVLEELELEGIDVMFVLDLSRSMRSEDLQPSRLEASQRVLREFLARRRGDRVGLVVFGRAPMLAAPLTLDMRALDEVVADLAIGDVPPRGTAIGDALGLAVAVLRRSDADSRVAILLSDGASNVSQTMSPREAELVAREMDIRIFTVLMGSENAEGEHGVDAALLEAIARGTGGAFFRASDTEALESTFQEVRDTLDKSRRRIGGSSPASDLFALFAWLAVVLLFFEVALRLTRWRRFP